ncbi:aldehyde dehydrogenase family protein [Peptoniphilus sp. MSJ-1]|uniref:Aldehyde dehydrogenase n=1 Tax=Peptoniphilus ovalis TaxID=2841503 RepID=A0ABS6FIK4_9FIRM|nr:aldehyde dehydrogenase family protein [Peptoniphilus ovalis]MBU5669844.1 aldehyde dehydrogenase family protein [Peptoniphilus ovalis]
MKHTDFNEIEEKFNKISNFYNSKKTKDILFRKNQLKSLLKTIQNHKEDIYAALKKDLNKSSREAFLTEYLLVVEEINHMTNHLSSYAKTKKKFPGMTQVPGILEIRKESFGKVLIISPWNYPFQLAMVPLIGAIAAGNTVILKPSEFSQSTSDVLELILKEALYEGLCEVVFGEAEEAEYLLNLNFDKIFFTGNPRVGKIVMENAAKNLIPVTLELGGKSPAIIHASADIKDAAKKIAFGKTMNSGQTCVAPDFVLVPKYLKEEFISEILRVFDESFPTEKYFRRYYPWMNKETRFNRMIELLEGLEVLTNKDSIFFRDTLQIFPCVVDEPSWEYRIMQEEIFGPLLPVLTYESEDELFKLFKNKEKPLALYVFSEDKKFVENTVQEIDSGGVCVNDTLLHISSSKAPFGGVGNSGMGEYHGKYSFDTFSRERTVLKKFKFFDFGFRYHPFKESFMYEVLRRIYK